MAPPSPPTVLITGASAGIGTAFAREYARRGCRLVLTARRLDRLESVAASLRRDHGVEVRVHAADFARPEAPVELHAALEREGTRIDILVANAGYALTGSYQSRAWSEHATFLQVMVTSYAELAHRLLPPMVEARWGRVVFVSSLAGLVPATAGHTLYAASKSFLIKLAQSLALEVEHRGVHVTAVCPGYTYSEFHDVAGIRDLMNRLPRFLWMDAETVARQGVDASEAGRVVLVTGRVNRGIALLSRLLPQAAVQGIIRRIGGRLRKA